jgi:phosphoglucosamine mutase
MLMQLPEYQAQSALVGTVMTNSGLEYVIREQGCSLLRTSVGDKYVAATMEEHNLLIGGETSGHIILKDYLSGGDGIFVALSVVRALQVTGNWDMKTFVKMPQVILNVPIERKRDLSQFPFSEIIDRYREVIGKGRILVRYSGTENVLRIMTEAPREELANSCATALAAELTGALQ